MTDLNPPRLDPISMAWNTVASYDSYEEAQDAVDRLSDEGFPVENLDIVGSGLHSVERVTGRPTLTATRYDIIARGGTAAQARSILQQAGLLEEGQPTDVPSPAVTGAHP
jgi:Heat induced stress protein YflT domain